MKCEYCDQRPANNTHSSIEDAHFCDSCFEGVLTNYYHVGTVEEALVLQEKENDAWWGSYNQTEEK